MAAVWPIALNDVAFEPGGFAEKWPNLMLRTEMEAGPAKQRRRFTTGPKPIEGSILIRNAEVPTLEAFWRDTLQGGVLPFEWANPRTQALATFRFTAPPELSPQSGGAWWRVALKLEIVS